MNVKLIAITKSLLPGRPSPEQLIEYAGRVCWRTELAPDDASCERFIDALVKKAHLSVIEHCSASFEISGVSRSCTHQLVRHRISSQDPLGETMHDYDLRLSISQESMRYVDQDNSEYICPESIGNHVNHHKLFQAHMQQAWALNHQLRKAGIRKEDARYVLPIAAASRLVLTMNFRSWLHFCEVRCHPAAQWEIRAVAMQTLRQLHEQAPTVFGAVSYTHLTLPTILLV